MGGIIHRLDPVRNSEFTEFSPSIPSLLGIDIPKTSRACGLFAPPWIAGGSRSAGLECFMDLSPMESESEDEAIENQK